MAKKVESKEGCLGVDCTNGSCVACQIAIATAQHGEVLAALTQIVAGLSDVAKEVTTLRHALLDAAAGNANRLGAAPRTEPAAPAKSEVPATPAPKTALPAKPEALTVDSVRPIVLEWVRTHGREALIAAFAKFNAQKLPDIKPSDLPAFVEVLRDWKKAGNA